MGKRLAKYVFILDDPFYLPEVLDKYLREFHDSTRGVAVQPVALANRGTVRTAWDLFQVYGLRYFLWKLRGYAGARLKATLYNGLLGSTRRCHSVQAVARKYGVPVDRPADVNAEGFRALLRAREVELIVSISGTQFYGRKLREQTPCGIINCHGALLPRYRGVLPSFWTLANGETEGGVTVHVVDHKIDNGPIVVQYRYRIRRGDTLEEVTARSKDLAAEAIIAAVRLIEAGDPPLLPNRESAATSFSMPTRKDVQRFLASGHAFY
jgi:methionyl-tRNA formyltransferase